MSADSLSHYPVGKSSKYYVCVEDSLIVAMVSKDDTHKQEENNSNLSAVSSEPEEKSSCLVEEKHTKVEEFHCTAAVVSESQEKTKSMGRNIKDRQREDPELKLLIDFHEGGVLHSDDKEARELLLSRA